MSATGIKLKAKKEYMLLKPDSIDQLEARLKDQPAYGWELFKVFSHGGQLVAIFVKETPSA